MKCHAFAADHEAFEQQADGWPTNRPRVSVLQLPSCVRAAPFPTPVRLRASSLTHSLTSSPLDVFLLEQPVQQEVGGLVRCGSIIWLCLVWRGVATD